MLRRWSLVVLLAACGTDPVKTVPVPAVAVAPDAAAPADAGASCDSREPPPALLSAPIVPCAPPAPAAKHAIEAALGAVLAAEKAKTHHDAELTIGCAQRDGWLVSAALVPEGGRMGDAWNEIWLVPNAGRPRRLAADHLGPVADFDGDGVPEASTETTTPLPFGEARYTVEVWFDRGAATRSFARTLSAETTTTWMTWQGRPALMFVNSEFKPSDVRFAPGETAAIVWTSARDAVREPAAPAALWAAGRCARTAIDSTSFYEDSPDEPPLPPQVLAAVPPARGTCARPGDDVRARVQQQLRAAIAQADHDRNELATAVAITWGCTSGGVTPVATRHKVQGDEPHVVTAIATVAADGTITPRYAARRDEGADGEGAHYLEYSLAGNADVDGDGNAETLLKLWDHEQSAFGSDDSYAVLLHDQLVPIAQRTHATGNRAPAFVRADRGDRDAIVFVAGEADAAGLWKWERHPPTVLVWDGKAFVHAPASALVRATAAARAALPAPAPTE